MKKEEYSVSLLFKKDTSATTSRESIRLLQVTARNKDEAIGVAIRIARESSDIKNASLTMEVVLKHLPPNPKQVK